MKTMKSIGNSKLIRSIWDPFYGASKLLHRCSPLVKNDETYVKLDYFFSMKKKLDLNNPKTFNEKLQWLKLNNRNKQYSLLVDKYQVKEYVGEILGKDYIIPTIGVWNSFDEIDFDSLPNQFVLKCTHDSGGLIVCCDKISLDREKAREKIEKCLKRDYYMGTREYPYKDVPHRIIAEKYMTNDDSSPELTDYKFFCFDGYVDCVMVCLDRHLNDTKFYFFNKDWELLRLNIRGKKAPEGFTIPKPKTMDEMFAIASQLSKGMKFVRIDLYEIRGHVYFGEYTFFPDSGLDSNLLPETDRYFGDLIKL